MFIRRDHFLNMICAPCPTGHFPVCHILLHKGEQEMANSQYEAKHSSHSNWSAGAINWSPPETDQNFLLGGWLETEGKFEPVIFGVSLSTLLGNCLQVLD